MGNSFFRFKQFTVHQERSAMKVCTDACLFGALAPVHNTAGEPVQQVLDIGTGTGLLSLMYAQRNHTALIDAVEIDDAAAQQAHDNFAASPWHNRLQLFHQPIQQYQAAAAYELIISNPPFYAGSLKSDDTRRNLALHSDALQLEELFTIAGRQLSTTGWLYLLLPYHRAAESMIAAQEQGFYLHKHTTVRQTPVHPYFRSILQWSKIPVTVETDSITIMDGHQQYTAGFREALAPYYLYL